MKQMNVRAADKKINTKGHHGPSVPFYETIPNQNHSHGGLPCDGEPCLPPRAIYPWQDFMDALVAVAVDSAGVLQGFRTFITVLIQLGCVCTGFSVQLFRPVHCGRSGGAHNA